MNEMKTVLVCSPLPNDQIELLSQSFEVCVLDSKDPNYLQNYEQKLLSAHGLIGNGFPLTAKHLESAKLLEAVATVSVGYDRFDVPALMARGIKLTNTPNVLTETTADLGFSLIMSAARRITVLSEFIHEGQWLPRVEPPYGTDIYGKRLGIVGFGRIGQAIARRGHFGFGMSITYYNRTERLEARAMKAERVELDQLCAESDFICVVIPLTAETTNLIGPSEFALMKKSAVVVNIARGKVVDETALIHALKTKSIFGAGLDVFQKEPLPMNSELLHLKNVVLTPHIGSATHETRYAMAALAVKNLSMALQGKIPPNWVKS